MLGEDHRFIDPNIEEIESIKLEDIKVKLNYYFN